MLHWPFRASNCDLNTHLSTSSHSVANHFRNTPCICFIYIFEFILFIRCIYFWYKFNLTFKLSWCFKLSELHLCLFPGQVTWDLSRKKWQWGRIPLEYFRFILPISILPAWTYSLIIVLLMLRNLDIKSVVKYQTKRELKKSHLLI
jgi:hypothetical protein